MINVNGCQLMLGLSAVGTGISLSRGHEVTLFNRGRSQTDLFPNVEKLVGDRDVLTAWNDHQGANT